MTNQSYGKVADMQQHKKNAFFRTKSFWVYVLLIAGAVVVAYPFFILVMNSFKQGSAIENAPASFPHHLTLAGFIGVFKSLNMLNLFKNSTIIAGGVTLLNITFGTMAAYALAKIEFKGRKFFIHFMLGSMMIPGIILLVPTYEIIFKLGWLNTYKALIIPESITAYNIFLLRQFIKSIPDAYLEAARIDGCSEFRILWNLIVPMSRPVIATVAVLTFMGSWDDLFHPLLYLHSPNMYTVQLGLVEFKSKIPGPHLEELWSATLLAVLPVILLFIAFQKHFVKAFTNVGLK